MVLMMLKWTQLYNRRPSCVRGHELWWPVFWLSVPLRYKDGSIGRFLKWSNLLYAFWRVKCVFFVFHKNISLVREWWRRRCTTPTKHVRAGTSSHSVILRPYFVHVREINTHMYDANLLCATSCLCVYGIWLVYRTVVLVVRSTIVRLQITDMLFLSTTYEYECRWGILQGYFHKIEG